MKKIIIAIFIVIATLGIAAGTTAKKAPVKTTTSKTTTTTKKSTSTPKKEVTDPYVGWWYVVYDQATAEEEGDDSGDDKLFYVSKENGKYYLTYYVDFPKTKGAKLCKNYDGAKYEVTLEELLSKLKINKFGKRATKEQVERLKYNMENGIWKSQKLCDQIN